MNAFGEFLTGKNTFCEFLTQKEYFLRVFNPEVMLPANFARNERFLKFFNP